MPQTKIRKPDSRGRAPPPRSWLQWSLLVVALALMFLPGIVDRGGGNSRIPYSTFVQLLDSGRISRVEVGESYLRGIRCIF